MTHDSAVDVLEVFVFDVRDTYDAADAADEERIEELLRSGGQEAFTGFASLAALLGCDR